MPEIKKDEVISERRVVVSFRAYEVMELIKNAAFKQLKAEHETQVTSEVTCRMTCKDSAGYEHKTEGLAEGASVTFIIQRIESE